MRNRLMIAMVAALMLLPASAFADGHVEVDICYADPTDPACFEDEEHETTAELAETGVSATLFAVIASLMLGVGALLVVATRRRASAA